MSERVAIPLLATALAVLCGAACDQECDCPDCGGGGGDGGVTCDSQPAACADLGDDAAQHFGCCFEGTVYWCDGDALESVDCEYGGHECGYSAADDYMDCI